jgi:hypothetical protein
MVHAGVIKGVCMCVFFFTAVNLAKVLNKVAKAEVLNPKP